MAIGDRVLSLRAAAAAAPLAATAAARAGALHAATLNPLLSLGNAAWRELRSAVRTLLAADSRLASDAAAQAAFLVPQVRWGRRMRSQGSTATALRTSQRIYAILVD